MDENEALYLLKLDLDPEVKANLEALLGMTKQVAEGMEITWRSARENLEEYNAEFGKQLNFVQEVVDAEASLNAQRTAAFDKEIANINATAAAEQKLADQRMSAFQASISNINATVAAEEKLNAQREEALRLIQAEAEAQAANQRALVDQGVPLNSPLGYGTSGGMIGPAEAGGGEEDGGAAGGTTVGSAFAIGHGLSVGGHALGAPALSNVGAFVYIEESLRRVAPLAQEFNLAMHESEGLFPALTTGLSNAGVPMAGLVATLGPLAIAAAAAAAIIVIGVHQIEEGVKNLQNALDAQKKYYDDVNKLDSEQAQKRLDELNKDQAAYAAKLVEDRGALVNALGHSKSADPVEALAGIVAVKQLTDEINSLKDKSSAAYQEAIRLGIGLDKGAFFANDLKVALEGVPDKLGQVRDGILDLVQRAADALAAREAAAKAAYDKSKQEGYAKDVGARISGYQALGQDYDRQYGQPAAQSEAEMAAQKAANEQYAKEQAKAASDAIKDLGKAAEDFTKKSADLVTSLATQQENARQKEADAEQQYMRGSLEDIHERGQIATAESRKETELKQQTADKIADIALKEQQKEASIQDDFRNQLLEDQIKVNQDSQKLTTDFQRTEREDSIEHEQRLADIKQQSHVQDQAALLDRNFLQLAKNQLTQNDAESKENISFQRREDKLARHLSDQQQDLEGHYAQEIAQQQRAETRKILLSQQAAFNEENQQQVDQTRKITALRASEQQQLDDLTANETYKIAILQRNLANELILYTQQEAAKMKLLQATTDAINQQAKQAYMNSGGDRFIAEGMTGHAQGGGFLAGEPFAMNEPGFGNETLMLGSRGYNVGGAALVYPMQGGSVNANKGDNGLVFAPTINAPAGVDRAWLMGTLSKMKDDMWEKLQDIHG